MTVHRTTLWEAPGKGDTIMLSLPDAGTTAPLVDGLGRRISYLRLSVTDRCNFRCGYCMAEDPDFLPHSDLLTLEELARLSDLFMTRGVRRIRLTGGEPLVRKNVLTLISLLGDAVREGRLDEVTLTTNGSLLSRFAPALAKAGVRRINVSLDSMRPEVFRAISPRGRLEDVLAGIAAARQAGLSVKLNTVLQKGINDAEVPDLMGWAHDRGMDMTLIEVMPVGRIGVDRAAQHLSLAAFEQHLAQRFTLSPSRHRSGGPARYVTVAETGGRLGFITPLSHSFCEGCNRVRLSCTGTLYTCLGHEGTVELRDALRGSEGNAAVAALIEGAVAAKPRGHDFVIGRSDASAAVGRGMNVTGG